MKKGGWFLRLFLNEKEGTQVGSPCTCYGSRNWMQYLYSRSAEPQPDSKS